LIRLFAECTYNKTEEQLVKCKKMQSELKEQMKALLKDNILSYTICWDKDKGVSADNAEHKKYLNRMKEEFVERLCKMIQSAVDSRKETHSELTNEITEHILFCQNKCKNFHGREETLKVFILS